LPAASSRREVRAAGRGGKAGLTVRFWGVRGSIPSPGPRTTKVGGNTSCVEVRAGDQVLIFDMGTGLRSLGEALFQEKAGEPIEATIFVSHYHWDHIQGLPFFGPGFAPRNRFTIYGPDRNGQGIRDVLAGQMVPPYFPVPLEALRAQLDFKQVKSGGKLQVGPASVTAKELYHPGGVFSYRVDLGKKAVVYATDFEHGTEADDALVEFASGADVLIIDSQYTPDEYAGKNGLSRVGWGHSTWREAAAFAERAEVKTLVLFHHDPTRSDAGVSELVRLARKGFSGKTVAARESDVIEL
jgi:phosphoribosyl 1,2-cyclic phosphodiesterase